MLILIPRTYILHQSAYMKSASMLEIQKRDQTIKQLSADLKKERDEVKRKDSALQKYEAFYREVKARSAEKARQRQQLQEQQQQNKQKQGQKQRTWVYEIWYSICIKPKKRMLFLFLEDPKSATPNEELRYKKCTIMLDYYKYHFRLIRTDRYLSTYCLLNSCMSWVVPK